MCCGDRCIEKDELESRLCLPSAEPGCCGNYDENCCGVFECCEGLMITCCGTCVPAPLPDYTSCPADIACCSTSLVG